MAFLKLRAVRFAFITCALIFSEGCSTWEDAKSEVLGFTSIASTEEFVAGVVAGFAQSGLDLFNDGKKIAEAAQNAAKNFDKDKAEEAAKKAADAVAGFWKLGQEEFKKVVDDPAKAVQEVSDLADDAAKLLKEYAAQFKGLTDQLKSNTAAVIALLSADDYEDKIQLLMLGEWEDLKINVSDEMKEAILDAIGFLEFAWDDIKALEPKKKGMIVGGVLFSVFPWGKALKGVTGVGGRLLGIKKNEDRLKACGLPAEVITRWEGERKIIEIESWCFHPDTHVMTPVGPKSIGSLVPGDLVLSRDEHDWSQEFKRVLAVHETIPDQTLTIHGHLLKGLATGIAPPAGTFDIQTTPNHPFWSSATERFVRADSLRSGDVLSTNAGGSAVIDSATQDVTGEIVSYFNLEVEQTHTYFVGDAGIWVHNAATSPCKLFWQTIRLNAKMGIPAHAMANGKLLIGLPKASMEYYAMMYSFFVKAPDTKTERLVYKEMLSVLTTYRTRNFPKDAYWRAPRLTEYGKTGGIKDVPKKFQFHHVWPRRYMKNASDANYDLGLTIEVPNCVHTVTGTGMDHVLDDYLMRKMKADGFKWIGGTVGSDPVNPAAEIARVPDFFLSLTQARRLELIRGCYRDKYLLDLPEITFDGLRAPTK